MRRIFLSVAVLSAGVLAYEILLTRLLSIVQWHHFAYMIISLALLGFGVSGTFLTFAGRRLAMRFPLSFAVSAGAFAVSVVACFLIAQRVPFNPLELAWSGVQLFWLVCIYLLLALPFFFAASCIGLAFLRFPDLIAKTYAYDLAGAAFGCGAVLWLLYVPNPMAVLVPVSATGALAAVVTGVRNSPTRWLTASTLVIVAALLTWISPFELHVSQYKALEQATRVTGAAVVATRSGPLGTLTVVENHEVPFRHAPGLSLNAPTLIPEQVAVYTDADRPTMITRFDGDTERLAYLDYSSSALPYHLREVNSVLVLGAGAGADVLLALYHGASRVTAVELNEQLVEIVREDYGQFSGGIYHDSRVDVHIAEARGFVARDPQRYDLVQMALLGSFGSAASGLQALNEGHLYTVEAMQSYIHRLRPDGLLAVTLWVKVPPRDGIKLFATALAALESSGSRHPESQIAWIRGWNNATLVIKNGRLTREQILGVMEFAESRSFDVAYYPGMSRGEANRFNLLPEPLFFDAASALLGPQQERFLARYKFHVAPASDDRPYFFRFFKWRHLRETLALRTRGGVGLLELGYVVLIAALVQALVLSTVLILLPLAWLRRGAHSKSGDPWRGSRMVGYFVCIGLAFLFIEIAFMQSLVRFLSHPVYAIAVVLASFLLFAALGSARVASAGDRPPQARRLLWPVIAIAVICALYALFLPGILERFMHVELGWRIIVAVALIAPLAVAMGMPFPLGLQSLRSRAPELVAWAWGINGCASVVSAVLAAVLAVHFGYTMVIITAACLYVSSLLIGWRGFGYRNSAIVNT